STGVCWSAKIMAVRVLDATGTGTSATITQGINFAVTNGAKVINLSVGGSTLDSAYNTAITNAQSSGVVVVAAAGNNGADNDSGTTPTYPCNYTQSNLVCVAALDQSYALASFSNYGSTSVDVGAPGVNIVSEWPGTATTVTDALTSGWNGTGGWGYKSLTFGVATDCLVDPPTYDRSTVGYANNAIHKVYKNIDLSGADVALLDYKAIIDTQLSHDFFSTAAKAAGGDPFSSGTTVASVDGTTSGLRTEFTYDISFCNTATCTIGFQISADNDGFNDYGVGISLFSINKLSLNTTSYNVIAGTSMAAPHVAGVAAMLMAYNPNYTYQDVVTAIKSGGIATASLSGKTTTGNAVSAMGSLAYINAPTGVAVVKQ
ncbi:MAG: S8 family serine peptidase, partial [Pseudobdellovibrionaceae bacterium]